MVLPKKASLIEWTSQEPGQTILTKKISQWSQAEFLMNDFFLDRADKKKDAVLYKTETKVRQRHRGTLAVTCNATYVSINHWRNILSKHFAFYAGCKISKKRNHVKKQLKTDNKETTNRFLANHSW